MKFPCLTITTLPSQVMNILGCLVIVMYCCVPFAGGTVIVFTVFDIFAELESWGRVTLGRFNASGAANTGWPVPDIGHLNSQTVELTEVRLLDQNNKWVKSHRFDSNLRNFAVRPWHEEHYHGLRAHARKIETIRLGEVNGEVDMLVYIILDDGFLNMSTSGLSQNVTRGDVIIELEFENVTEGCTGCEKLEVELSLWGHCQGQCRGQKKGSTSVVTEMSMTPGDAHVWLPNTVLIDGNVSSLCEEYPRYQQWDTSAVVTLCMPAPSPTSPSSAAYSLLVRLGGDSTAHLIPERVVHKMYHVEDQLTTQTTLTDQVTDAPLSEDDDNKSEKDKGKGSNNAKVINPEYKHVRDNSDGANTLSLHLPLLSALLIMCLFAREIYQ